MTATSTFPLRNCHTTPPAARTSGIGARRATSAPCPLFHTNRQALHQKLLEVVAGMLGAPPLAVGLQVPGRRVVLERSVQVVREVGSCVALGDRARHLYPAVEVAVHHVRRTDPVLRVSVTAEVVDARVLQEAAEDGPHPNVFRQAGN